LEQIYLSYLQNRPTELEVVKLLEQHCLCLFEYVLLEFQTAERNWQAEHQEKQQAQLQQMRVWMSAWMKV
jgi:uncharacterized phage-like protein YoqJ